MKNFFSFSFMFLFLYCFSQHKKKKTNIVEKRIEQASQVFLSFKMGENDKLNLRASDSFLTTEIISDIKNDEKITLQLSDSLTYVYLYKDTKNQSALFLKNGDSIEISFLNGQFSFLPVSKNLRISNLSIYSEYFNFVRENIDIKSISLEKTQAIIRNDLLYAILLNSKLYKIRSNFLDSYSRNNPIDRNYKEAFLSQYKFNTLNLDYLDIQRFENNNFRKQKFSEIKTFFASISINAEMMPGLFKIVIDYCKIIGTEDIKNNQQKFAKLIFKTIVNNFDGKNRDLLLLNLLENGRDKETLRAFLNEFEKLSKNQIFIHRAKVIVSKNELAAKYSIDRENTFLSNTKGEKIKIQDLFKKYKGKVIYIDFWASWCAPCLQQIPYSLKQSKFYKNIEFVYISIDRSEKSWIKSNDKLLLGTENSYLIQNQDSSKFLKEIGLSSIPRHVIIDGNGKIVNYNAPGAEDDVQFEKIMEKF